MSRLMWLSAFCMRLYMYEYLCTCVQLLVDRAHNQLVLSAMQQLLANPRTTTPFAAVLLEHLVAHMDMLEGSPLRSRS